MGRSNSKTSADLLMADWSSDEHRLDYLDPTSWSPWNDVRFILRTLPIVSRDGAG